MEGPVTDTDGVRVQIRYQRKTKQQYLMTDIDGKATGWRADFENGAWQITEKSAPKKAAKKPAKKPAKKAAKKATKKPAKKAAVKRKVVKKKSGDSDS